jgi:hypothetical protein
MPHAQRTLDVLFFEGVSSTYFNQEGQFFGFSTEKEIDHK